MDNNQQNKSNEPRFLREKFLNNILDHIEHSPDTDQSYVLAIDGVFGSGKSFFLDKEFQ